MLNAQAAAAFYFLASQFVLLLNLNSFAIYLSNFQSKSNMPFIARVCIKYNFFGFLFAL